MARVVANPVIVALKHGLDHIALGIGKGCHIDAGIHDFTDNPIRLLLCEACGRVGHPRVQSLIAPRHEFVGFGIVQTMPRDAEASHIHQRRAKGHIGARRLAGGVLHKTWRT